MYQFPSQFIIQHVMSHNTDSYQLIIQQLVSNMCQVISVDCSACFKFSHPSCLLFALTGTLEAQTYATVLLRLSTRLLIFSLTAVSAGQVSALRFWWFWPSCRTCSTVMDDVPQWHTEDSPMQNFEKMWCLSLECPVLRCTFITDPLWSSHPSWSFGTLCPVIQADYSARFVSIYPRWLFSIFWVWSFSMLYVQLSNLIIQHALYPIIPFDYSPCLCPVSPLDH